MGVCNIGECATAQARSIAIGVLCPNIVDRPALKQKEEEVYSAEEHHDREIDVDDPDLILLARKTEEINSN